MIQIENLDILGWEPAIRGMRNPKNSWHKADSVFTSEGHNDGTDCPCNCPLDTPEIGENDMELMRTLINAGTDHRKFMRMITVYVDIVAPLYWWKEFDTYKVGTVANSCSTMHKIQDKKFVLNDFSHEHLNHASISCLSYTIDQMNGCRDLFLETKDKSYWWQMIQLLPSSYNQRRTVMMNYEVLANMYKSRQYHKLDEWKFFCDWIKSLPYSELITREEK